MAATKIHVPEFASFYEELELRSDRPEDSAAGVKDLLARTKVLRLVPGWHIADLRSFYHRLTGLIAQPVDIGEDYKAGGKQTGERWLEIRYDHDIPDLAAYRHSKNAQPLHTDESYIPDPADVMLFYSVNRAQKGGATLFVDLPEVAAHLKTVDPELFRSVTTEVMTYRKAERARSARILDLSVPGAPAINYNYYCLDPEASAYHKGVNQKFFEYLRDYVMGSHMCRGVPLNPGEAVLWWDHFVLHGRNAFTAEKTDDRFIWKTGMRWR